MFDQTFVPAGKAARPGSLLLSVTIQSAVISALVLASLAYKDTLPFRQLHTLLVAPRPPLPPQAAAPAVRKVPVRPALNALHLRLLPIRIAPSRASVNAAAPAIISGNTDSRVDVSSALGDIIGAPLAGTPQQQPPRQKPAPEPSSAGPVRIGGSVAAANLIQQVRPVYPHLAALAGVSGAVEFSAIIGRDGRIANLRLLRGHPLLVRAAADAVRQWRYRPTLLNGIPVEVATDITVQFNLSNAN